MQEIIQRFVIKGELQFNVLNEAVKFGNKNFTSMKQKERKKRKL